MKKVRTFFRYHTRHPINKLQILSDKPLGKATKLIFIWKNIAGDDILYCVNLEDQEKCKLDYEKYPNVPVGRLISILRKQIGLEKGLNYANVSGARFSDKDREYLPRNILIDYPKIWQVQMQEDPRLVKKTDKNAFKIGNFLANYWLDKHAKENLVHFKQAEEYAVQDCKQIFGTRLANRFCREAINRVFNPPPEVGDLDDPEVQAAMADMGREEYLKIRNAKIKERADFLKRAKKEPHSLNDLFYEEEY